MIGLPLWAKVLGPFALIAALVLPWKVANHWKGKAADYAKIASDRQVKIEGYVGAIARISGNPKLREEESMRQLEEVGARLTRYKQEALTCSASVDQLQAEGVRRQREADAALSGALNRRREAENAVRRLEASARSGSPGQCLSPEVERRWKQQP